MKMSSMNYMAVKLSIDAIIEQHGIDYLKRYRQSISFAKCQFTSFCWSIFHASKHDYKVLYDAGLNDNHIETAIKKILVQFK